MLRGVYSGVSFEKRWGLQVWGRRNNVDRHWQWWQRFCTTVRWSPFFSRRHRWCNNTILLPVRSQVSLTAPTLSAFFIALPCVLWWRFIILNLIGMFKITSTARVKFVTFSWWGSCGRSASRGRIRSRLLGGNRCESLVICNVILRTCEIFAKPKSSWTAIRFSSRPFVSLVITASCLCCFLHSPKYLVLSCSLNSLDNNKTILFPSHLLSNIGEFFHLVIPHLENVSLWEETFNKVCKEITEMLGFAEVGRWSHVRWLRRVAGHVRWDKEIEEDWYGRKIVLEILGSCQGQRRRAVHLTGSLSLVDCIWH